MNQPSIDVVIVQFHGGHILDRCVAACMEDELVSRVIIVDNEGISHKLSARYATENVRVIPMSVNAGYATAANRGLDEVRGDGALILNQDALVAADAIPRMLRVGSDSSSWVVGPRLVDLDGNTAELKSRFPTPMAWEAPVPLRGRAWRYVPWVPGAAMLLMPGHTDLRFDQRFFMYVEDEELCWRVWDQGGAIAVAEDALVVHEGGSATSMRWSARERAARATINRARAVRWHRGWRGLASYLLSLFTARGSSGWKLRDRHSRVVPDD